MATTNKIRALNRLPYDFDDGLKIAGVDVSALTTSAGSGVVGHDGTTVKAVLDTVKPIANYAALRVYTGTATQIRITDPGIEGFFYYDPADTTSVDNGGTTIVSGSKRWKRHYSGAVNVKWFGAKGDWNGTTGTDDTAAIQNALNSASEVIVVPYGSIYKTTGTLTVAESQIFEINGVIKKISGSSPIITINNASCVIGIGEIDGSSVVCDGIFSSGKNNIQIDGLYIHDVGGKGIATYTSGSNAIITNNNLKNIGQQAISVEYIDGVIISNNRIDTALHGIQWWGGDSNTSTTVGTSNINIFGNNVKNVMGGIWGSLGRGISVTGNHVENCSDVGIDFEGCTEFSCTGNVAHECANGCYAVFFGCSYGTFSGNAAKNTASDGSGFYATTNSTYVNRRIVISNNSFRTKKKCLYADQNNYRSLIESSIVGNMFISDSTAITVLQNEKLLIANNQITTIGSRLGIELQSVRYSMIRDNMLYGFSDPSTVPTGGTGGIWLYQQSSTNSSIDNIIQGNRIDSYVYSIVDECPADVTKSRNDIKNNSLTNVYRTTGATYNGRIVDNYYIYSPTTTISATAF